jgi:hypothetical protein
MKQKYEMRIVLFVYHLFWAAPGMYESLHAAIVHEPFPPIDSLIISIVSLPPALGFLFKFSNKTLLYTLSLLLNILYLVSLVRTHLNDPGLLGIVGPLMIMFTIYLVIRLLRVVYKQAFIVNIEAGK